MIKTLKTLNVIYYSPTGTSATVANAVANGTNMGVDEVTDITFSKVKEREYSDSDLVIIAVPVYAGRVAPAALDRLKGIKGNNTPAIIVVVYGNRDYDDALLELNDEVRKMGFTPVAAGAFVGEHSFSRKNMPVAEGRPDKDDVMLAEEFGCKCIDNYNTLSDETIKHSLNIKGNYPYKPFAELPPVSPESTDDCNLCGVCVTVCPTDAIVIDSSNPKPLTDAAKCTLCCACVKKCPSGVRIFETPFTKMLFENFSKRREPETIFLQ